MDIPTEFRMDENSYWGPSMKKRFQALVTTAATTAAKNEERKKAANENAKLAQEYALKEKALKRKAAQDVQSKEDIISYLIPPKSAKNDYLEQKPAKYVFKCRDGDIQIPEYGIFRTDFYYKERIHNQEYWQTWKNKNIAVINQTWFFTN